MRTREKEVLLKDGTKCLLRSVEVEDGPMMIAYLKTTAEESEFLVGYPEEITTTPEEETVFIRDILESKRNFMIGAFVDGRVVGTTGVNCLGERRKLSHRAELGIAVRRSHWNLGVGTALLQTALEQAKEIGYEQVELGVCADNAKAWHLYNKNGFENWGVVKYAFKLKDGSYRDEILMGIRF